LVMALGGYRPGAPSFSRGTILLKTPSFSRDVILEDLRPIRGNAPTRLGSKGEQQCRFG
jgi:hypothetical protein